QRILDSIIKAGNWIKVWDRDIHSYKLNELIEEGNLEGLREYYRDLQNRLKETKNKKDRADIEEALDSITRAADVIKGDNNIDEKSNRFSKRFPRLTKIVNNMLDKSFSIRNAEERDFDTETIFDKVTGVFASLDD